MCKKKSKLSIALIFLFAIQFIGCDNTNDVETGPCEFAPPESKFPEFQYAYCPECYLDLQFLGKEYSFTGNQLETWGGGPFEQPPDKFIVYGGKYNSFLSFKLVSPASAEDLVNSINVKTSLLTVDAINKLVDYPIPVSASFGIYNYCGIFFEPLTDNISQSYNQITDIELIHSNPGSVNGEEYQMHVYYCFGKINATFILNGEMQVLTGNYKVVAQIFEKL